MGAVLAIDLLKALKLLGTASDVYISSSALMQEEQENTSPTNNATIRNKKEGKRCGRKKIYPYYQSQTWTEQKSDLENFGADLEKSLSDRNFIGIYGLEWRRLQNGHLISFVFYSFRSK